MDTQADTQTDTRTHKSTDGRADKVIPVYPQKYSFCGGKKNCSISKNFSIYVRLDIQ